MNSASQRRTTHLVATALAFLGMVILAGCDHQRSSMLPRQLEGVWTTDDPRYKDRFLELSQAFVIIVTGREDAPSVQLIDHVETTQQGSELHLTVYSIDHRSGEEYTMNLGFKPQNGGELKFSNQSQIWRRRLPDPPAKPTRQGPPNGGRVQPPKRDPFSRR